MTKVTVTTHGRRRLIERMGTGCNPEVLAQRCWDKDQPCPPEWQVPSDKLGFRYLRYGDCAFIFGPNKALVTVVGPPSGPSKPDPRMTPFSGVHDTYHA